MAKAKAEVLINKLPIETDSLISNYLSISRDSAELGLEYAKSVYNKAIEVKEKIIEERSNPLKVESFELIETDEMTSIGIPKREINICFNRKIYEDEFCLMFYYKFKSGEGWRVNSRRIKKSDLSLNSCLYEEVKYSAGRLGYSLDDINMKKFRLKKGNIKSVKIEVYDECWQYNYEQKNRILISSKEFKY